VEHARRIEQCKEALREARREEHEAGDSSARREPLQSFYVEERFGDTFSYIDNMMNQFFSKHVLTNSLEEATKSLNQSFEAKLALKVSDLSIRRSISQDYTLR